MIIWYNPDTDRYQKGCYNDFETSASSSRNGYRFELLYEFKTDEITVMNKILNSLNTVRTSPVN